MKETIDDNKDVRIFNEDGDWISMPVNQVTSVEISRSNLRYFDIHINNEYLVIKRRELP